jgi:catechol-2,3-dioxygenase
MASDFRGPRIRGLNHAVLFVRELEASIAFYTRAFGMSVVTRVGPMAFFRLPGSANHHDLGICALGPQAPSFEQGSAVGLYHLAWEVAEIEELVAARDAFLAHGTLSGMSDHGATKSIYGTDPDGNEHEILWMVPRDQWGAYEDSAPTRRLDLAAELARFGTRKPQPA